MEEEKNTIARVFGKHAHVYQQKFMDVSMYKEGLDIFIQNLPEASPVLLDIGCGPGNISQYIVNKIPQAAVTGIDIAHEMLELAALNNPGAVFMQMDARNISELQPGYHGITSAFCTPYLTMDETRVMMRQVADLLFPGGVFYLSTIEKDYATSGPQTSSTGDVVSMYYYLETDLMNMLIENKFKILYTQRVQYIYHNQQVTDIVLVSQK